MKTSEYFIRQNMNFLRTLTCALDKYFILPTTSISIPLTTGVLRVYREGVLKCEVSTPGGIVKHIIWLFSPPHLRSSDAPTLYRKELSDQVIL